MSSKNAKLVKAIVNAEAVNEAEVVDQVVDQSQETNGSDVDAEIVQPKEGFFKRHSKALKRAAIGAGAAAIGLIGFIIGKGASESEDDEESEDDDFEYDDEAVELNDYDEDEASEDEESEEEE